MSKYAHFADGQRSFIKRVAGPLFLLFIMFYLGFHALSGERGLFALFTESRKLEMLQAELEKVKAERVALEQKTYRLSNTSLDLDLLDEQVRRVLGKAGKNEAVFFLDETPVK